MIGSVLSAGGNLVLTAAHCTNSDDFRLDMVRLGAHNLGVDSEVGHDDHDDGDDDELQAGAEDFTVKEVVVYPEYSPGPIHTHDMAVLVLATPDGPITSRPEVSPVCLPSPGDKLLPGAPLTVAGWGNRRERGDKPDRLHEVLEASLRRQRLTPSTAGVGECVSSLSVC